jgi:hypothetical protein
MLHEATSHEHPLRAFFRSQIHASLCLELGLDDTAAEVYLASLITDFIRADATEFDICGRRVADLGQMLRECDALSKGATAEEARRVHKHVGDWVMFWAGVFPERIKAISKKKSTGLIVDPIQAGRSSYFVVSTVDHGEFSLQAPLFRRLSQRFETYILGLRLARDSWSAAPIDWKSVSST